MHLVGILFPHINDDARSKSHQIHLNITLQSRPVSSQWSLYLSFPNQNPPYASSLPIRTTCPTHLILLDFITRTISDHEAPHYAVFSTPFLTSFLLGPNVLLNTLFSRILSLLSSLSVSDQVSHPHKTTGKVTVLYIFIFLFLDSKLQDRNFATNDRKHSLTSIYS